MERNELNNIKDEKIKNLNKEELIIYNYLTEQNKEKIKTDLQNKLSGLKKEIDLIPKIEEKDENLTNNLIKNYFQDKESQKFLPENKKSNIIYTIENLFDEKDFIEKKIREKNEVLQLLQNLKSSIESKKIEQTLIQKINNNTYLSKNQELKNYISQINNTNIKIQENEDLTEEQRIICSFRNIIKNSYEEAKTNITIDTTILQLFEELKFENIDIQPIINENEGIGDNVDICKDEKIMEFKSNIKITPSFYVFLKELNKYNIFNSKEKNNTYIFYKVINLLISRYNSYTSEKNKNDNIISTLILMHNNLEVLTYLINYYILFYNNDDKNNSLINIVIKIKKISVSILTDVFVDFNSDLPEELSQIETFENIYKENIFEFVVKKVEKTINMIFKFFDNLMEIAIHRDIIFYFNDVLTIYFDLFNQKILLVNNYDLNDIQSLLNLSQEILKNMKKNIEKISSKNIDLSIKFMNILEQNLNYLKFQEILFILNSNLKQIKNYLINANFSIYIRKDQFLTLLYSTFNESDKLKEVVNLINENIK
jgi:hypothetical protein